MINQVIIKITLKNSSEERTFGKAFKKLRAVELTKLENKVSEDLFQKS